MLKLLTPRMHAPIDYLLVVLFALAPTVLGFGGIAAGLSIWLGVGYFVMSALTAYPLGIAKLIPFPVHGLAELALAPVLVASPWIFGFARVEPARWFFVAIGIGALIVWLVTDYQRAEIDESQRYLRGRTRGSA